MGKNLFNEVTGKFNNKDNMTTKKNARINAKSSIPRLEVGGESKVLSNKAFSIGRDKSNQIIVSDPKVSRYHAIITFQNDVAVIKDTDSSNGTYVNDKQIAPNKKVQLKNGDRIKVGTTVIIFYR